MKEIEMILQKLICSVIFFIFLTSSALAFSFSEYERKDAAQSKKGSLSNSMEIMRVNCLNDKKIATVIGEKHERGWRQPRLGFGSIITELNDHFRKFGLKTFSQSEITSQIAQAEQEAVLNNDLDAAVSAASSLGADLFLRGIISTKVQKNKFVGVDEVFVTLSLSLVNSDGSIAASTKVNDAVFSDADTTATVFRLVKKNAEQIIADLTSQFCNK